MDGDVPLGDDFQVLDDLQGDAPAPLRDDDESDLDDGEAGPADEERMVEDDSEHSFEGHTDAVVSVAWSPAHPDLVASGGQDDRAFIWRVGQDAYEDTAGTLSTHELSGHSDTIASLAFNQRGTLLATGGMDGVVKVWNAADGSLVRSLDGPGGSVDWVRWHPKGDVLLAGSDDFTMWMWLAQMGTCMQVFAGHQGAVTCGMFTHDGKAVVSTGGEDDCSLRAWSPKTGECLVNLRGHPFHEAAIVCCDVHPDNQLVATGGEDGSLRVSSIQGQGRVLASLEGHEDSVEAVGFSHHLPLAASASVDCKLLVWDVASGGQRGLCQHDDAVTCLAWHPSQPLVFSGCADGVVRAWDLRTAQLVRQWGGHGEAVQGVATSPDGSLVLSGSDDGTAKVFRL